MRTALFALLFAAAGALAGGAAADSRPSGFQPAPSLRAATSSPTPTAAPSLSPDEIFHKAIRALRQNPDPPYITYMMHEVFVHHGRSYAYDYRVWYRTDGKGLMQDVDSARGGRQDTYFGYPFPSAPDNNILLYATPPPISTPLPSPQNSAPPGMTPAPLLGVEPVRSDRYYDVSFVGRENYEGHQVYHLALRAVRDEQAHPWKDLWIDVNSFQVWKAHANASGSRGPGHGSVDATAEFEQIGPYWLLARATGDGEVHIGFISDSGHYEYTFSDFGFPASVPDWFFDEKAFKKHFHS